VKKTVRNAAASIVSLAIRGLLATVRYRAEGYDAARELAKTRGGFVLALWHESIMVALGHDVRRGAVALVSPGSDGTFAARLVAPFGVGVVRGSSSREGAAGVRRLLKGRRAGGAVVVTPDGPRGPRRSARRGVVYVALRAGLPIIPLGVAVSSAKRLRSWDRFIVPKPFAKARLVYGPPIEPPAAPDRAALVAAAAEVESALARATIAAAAALGVPDS
jgi:lysophospholipid acyltransferase (LPLAT)-like uncharacterized protein